jgi:hypothetical protein
MATLKPMSPAEHKILKEDFWDKNDRLQRPLSPHLLIYKFEVCASVLGEAALFVSL